MGLTRCSSSTDFIPAGVRHRVAGARLGRGFFPSTLAPRQPRVLRALAS